MFVIRERLYAHPAESSSGPDPYFLEGPEDDSIRIETCCPNTIINIQKFCCV